MFRRRWPSGQHLVMFTGPELQLCLGLSSVTASRHLKSLSSYQARLTSPRHLSALLCGPPPWREAICALHAICSEQSVNFPYANPSCTFADLFLPSVASQFLPIDRDRLRACSPVPGLPFSYSAHLFLLFELLSWTDGSHIPVSTPIFPKSWIFSCL